MPVDVERAVRDPEYRKTLTPEELAEVRASSPTLTDDELQAVAGGKINLVNATVQTITFSDTRVSSK